ncbi:hypothetical protein [Microbacterium sp. LMI1-1-1.1]|uniref:hypothetical protein n=1 Tax=Microbacterium sp. LMI1-1-1.1 TaxID=3135223 RepID=UPI0034651D5E
MNDRMEEDAALQDLGLADGPGETAEPPPRHSVRERVAGWRGIVGRNRALWITTAVAVASLVAGLVVGRFVVSPADAAASAAAPPAGFVTVPVESGPLSNDVTLRAEVGYADPVQVQVDTSGLQGAAVVTGQVPAVGAELGPLAVALEVAGRPVIVLPGDLPSYRTLRYGVSGPDVAQFKQAMRTVGLDAGDPADPRFDEQAAQSVAALYTQVGYPAPATDAESVSSLRSAQAGVRAAEQAVATAQGDLAKAGAGTGAVDIREADNAVASARRAVDAARAESPQDAGRIADLEDALGLAQLRRQQLDAHPDTTAARAAVDAAQSQLRDARDELTRAQQGALPVLPAGELLYLTQLPRRVDAVEARRGAELKGTAMTVSGATVALNGAAGDADAKLLRVGAAAAFDLPDGSSHPATVAALTPGKTASDRWAVTLTPEPLRPEQLAQLQGKNVRVSVSVGTTDGDVLHVPVAALSAGPGGESRVEVVEGDPRSPETRTHLVVVETGLAAAGAVEVRPVDGGLSRGDLVVVGR